MKETDQIAFDSQVAHAMQMWLWRTLTGQLIKQKVIQPWDLYEWLGEVDVTKFASPADEEGFMQAVMAVKQMAQAVDARPYDEQPENPLDPMPRKTLATKAPGP